MFRFSFFPVLDCRTCIAHLKPGQQIMLKGGFGYPEAAQDTVQVVAFVEDAHAMLANGQCVCCECASGVTLLHDGARVRVVLSERARQRLTEAQRIEQAEAQAAATAGFPTA